jgi:hypothetical protein
VKTTHVDAQTERQVSVASEFASADLGDLRRERRLLAIARRLAARPATPFPRALATEADLEGFYRFVRNEEVTCEALLKPHVTATVGRMVGSGEMLAVHDTTEFRFGGTRKDLGRLGQSGHGFLGHFTLAVTADGVRAPLGTLAVESWARREPTATALRKQGKISYAESKAMPNEQNRWIRGVEAAEATVGGAASLIHVMDSEADDYDLMAKLGTGRRWVIRLCYDRLLANVEPGQPTKTKELVARRKVKCKRKVHLSRRRRQPGGNKRRRTRVRKERTASLAISATPVVFARPGKSMNSPMTLPVNIVAVREVNPPLDDEPVEWLLITTEPVETEEQILKIIDFYRGRWVIEEFFKALKTGCAFEKRQLESWHTLQNALGLLIPIAWSLLRLRTVAREEGRTPARAVLTDLELEVLRRASTTPLRQRPTTRDVMLAIARLGGHHRSNGEPGWQLLGRGYQDLLMMTAGYRLAVREK